MFACHMRALRPTNHLFLKTGMLNFIVYFAFVEFKKRTFTKIFVNPSSLALVYNYTLQMVYNLTIKKD